MQELDEEPLDAWADIRCFGFPVARDVGDAGGAFGDRVDDSWRLDHLVQLYQAGGFAWAPTRTKAPTSVAARAMAERTCSTQAANDRNLLSIKALEL
jgi:hypothetical protein